MINIRQIVASKKLYCPEVCRRVDIRISTGACVVRNRCELKPNCHCPLYVERLIKATAIDLGLCK